MAPNHAHIEKTYRKLKAESHARKLAGAVPKYPAHLQAVPTTTDGLCGACVAAEDVLVGAIEAHEQALREHIANVNAVKEASNEHATQGIVLVENNAAVANAKQVMQNVINGHAVAVIGDAPSSILSVIGDRNPAANAWASAIAARTAQAGVVDNAASALTQAENIQEASTESTGAGAVDVSTARSTADAACAAMRAGGYGAPPAAALKARKA